MIFYVVYTAPGLALFPITLIKRIPSLQISDEDTARQALQHNQESQRRIEVKYQGTGQQMSIKDRRELEALQREERTLARRVRLAEESGNRRRWWEKLGSALRPFKVAFGIILAVLGILIVISMLLTLYFRLSMDADCRVDKLKNSICGNKCGYILSNPQVFNPLNYIFLQSSKVYPIDYVFMVILILYFFISTVVGMIFVGIRFLWYSLSFIVLLIPGWICGTLKGTGQNHRVCSWGPYSSCSLSWR
jgi:LMBR1 domain-containing protein 1